MKILITGHKGFIGSNFYKKFDNGKNTIVGVDIKEGLDCRDFFKTCTDKFDIIVFASAIVGGRQKIEGEPLAVATDLSIDAEFFNWAIKTKQPGKIIYFSSSAAYPISLQKNELKYKLKESDINLNDIKNPDMTYGWVKLTGEYLAHFAKQQGLKIFLPRTFSGFGENQLLDYPFPSFIKRIVEKCDPFEIWGDGYQVRDWIHVDDVINGILACLDADYMEPLNLGWSRPTSFRELAQLMFDISKWTPKNGLKCIESAPSGVQYRCCDNTNMLKIYTPKITLEEGIERCLNYYKKYRI